ncbi:MAG: response regulator transcription factor [Pyrinomonadaceae bacterium]
MNKPIRVLLIEDQVLTCIGIKTILTADSNFEIVGTAGNTTQGLDLFRQTLPDVTLLSLRLPDSCAIDSLKDFFEILPKAKIIILAAHAGDAEISRSLQRGASGYLLKDASANELIKAVRTVNAGKKFIPANVASVLSENLGSETLTVREQKILEKIVTGLSNKEIALNLDITENTVKTHVKNILAKLQVSDRTAAATSAIKRGIVRVDF